MDEDRIDDGNYEVDRLYMAMYAVDNHRVQRRSCPNLEA
jgi:hypothetical protein